MSTCILRCEPACRTPASRGFSLLELLVALAIVSVLALLGASAIRQAQVASRQTACASNMRQIGIALNRYAADHDGDYPATAHGRAREHSWIYTLAPYLQNIDKVRICPADPHQHERLREGGSSYTLNSFVFNSGGFDPDGNRLPNLGNVRHIHRPAATILAFIVADEKRGISADHTHSESWTGWSALLADITPDRHGPKRTSPNRTVGSSNYLFADGHVKRMDAEDVKSRTESGENIARPPQML